MRTYTYKAYDVDGKHHKGKEDAPSEEVMRNTLKSRELFVVELTEYVKPAKRSEKLTMKEVPEFARSIGTLLTAGVPMAETMYALEGENKNAKLKEIFQKTGSYVREGVLFSDALKHQKEVFPPLLINMLSASEDTGNMGSALMRAAEYYEKQYRLQSKVRSAMAYPIFLLTVSLTIMMGIFTFVIPYFAKVIGEESLTGLTLVFMAISKGLRENFLYILIGVLIFLALISYLMKKPEVRQWMDRMLLRVPKIGPLFETIYTARFAQTMAYLYLSGVSVVDALHNSIHAIGNTYIASQFDGLIREVRSGRMLSDAILKIDGIQSSLKWPIKIGEESGELGNMLLSTSDALSYESERASEKLTSFLGPVMIVIIAVMIGMIMISVILPIFNMYTNIGAGYGS